MLRIIHTSDWHLGHTLYDVPREEEHRRFLQELLKMLEAFEADALLIAGDIFDTANPPAEAQRALYAFLAEARARMPRLQVVMIAGNHDSPARLDAPEALLRALGVRVVGTLPWSEGAIDADSVLVPLHDADGKVAAHVAAVPFLRPGDLPHVPEEDGDPLIEGVRRVYGQVLEKALSRRAPGEALIGMGHLYMVGTELSELSERKILGGNQHALPHDLFGPEWAYVALGHLHKAQSVGRDTVRYCGSPLPLSLSEREYEHQVCLVTTDGEQATEVRSLPLPRTVDLLRIPERGALSLEDALIRLQALPPAVVEEKPPFLEVAIEVARPEPTLRAKLEEALAGRAARLVKVTLSGTGSGLGLADSAPSIDLRELTPEQVFLKKYAKAHAGDPEPALLEAFHELVDEVGREEAS